ncbi:MAG: hypothetical protein ACXU8S_10265 [Phenylobacterium sp.]
MTRFSENLTLVLKLLSLSSAKLAASLEIDKSVANRWLNGRTRPSAHSLSRLSAFVATHAPGFSTLDWERDPESLAALFGADANAIAKPALPAFPPGLRLDEWGPLIERSRISAKGYEGFFRTTRPHPSLPGRFLIEHAHVRPDVAGLPSVSIGSVEVVANGWLMPLHHLVYIMVANPLTGTMLFGIFNGVDHPKVERFDGLIVIPSSNAGNAPVATAMICERIADLSGDEAADARRFAELTRSTALAAEDAVPDEIKAHLAHDSGPSHATTGDWVLTMSLARSLGRGPPYGIPASDSPPPGTVA